jgi:hypothetical protein
LPEDTEIFRVLAFNRRVRPDRHSGMLKDHGQFVIARIMTACFSCVRIFGRQYA